MSRPAPFARRRLLLGVPAVLTGGLLAGCASDPEPPPAPPTGAVDPEQAAPVTTVEQVQAVVTEVHGAVVAADEARDVSPLAPRVSGSAADFRTTVYSVIEQVEEWAEQLSVPGDEVVVPMTSTGREFPRVAIALVSDSEADGVPYFMALQQADARSPYTSWGWAQQAVGIEMPMVPHEEVGAGPVALDDAELLMPPSEALALYAKVLSDGDGADPEDLLAASPYQSDMHEQIQREREELNSGVEWDEAATIKEVYSVTEDEFAGLRTDDGGAIVMGTFRSTRTVSLRNEAVMRYSEENPYTRLLGRDEFTSQFVRDFGTTVALYVPAADAGAQIQPVGATRTALGASGE